MTAPQNQIVIYESADGAARLEVKFENETVWLSQQQIAELFGIERSVVTKHIRNIFRDEEVEEESNVQKMHIPNSDRPVSFYNLDIVLAVGYRANTKRGIEFRKWATRTLHDHLVRGFTVNENRLAQIPVAKLRELESAIALLSAAQQKMLSADETAGLLTIITNYAKTWLTLERYDRKDLPKTGSQKKAAYQLDYAAARTSIDELAANLRRKKEASELFGHERGEGLKSILAAVEQTFGGQNLYPTLEEKAAHLLYFLVKDHPFSDGNKRIGAFLFIVYLARNHFLTDKKGAPKLNDNALAALTLLVAESNPHEKEAMIALVVSLLRHKI